MKPVWPIRRLTAASATIDKSMPARHIEHMAKAKPRRSGIRLSIRIDLPDGSRFGPGKAALLSALAEQGSIAAAARSLNMSYPKALRLVDEMNTQFTKPLIETYQGGTTRGGASITADGEKVIALYVTLTSAAGTANAETLAILKALCK